MSSVEQVECPECAQIVHYQPQRWKSQVICSNCQFSFPVAAVQPPDLPGQEPIPIPSHLQEGSDTANIPGQTKSANPDQESPGYRRSKLGGNLTALAICVLLGAGLAGGMVALALFDNKTQEKKETEHKKAKEKKRKFVTAGKKRVKLGDLEIGIKLVEFGPLRVKDQNNKVHESSDSLLQIHVEIRSRRSNNVEYVSWYGNSFSRGQEQVVAELTDQQGQTLDMPVFGDVKGLFGHTPTATIEKNERISDCLIFELPQNTTIADIRELELVLPMECFGNKGNVYFRIPQDMIVLITKGDADQ
ncbi:MAG: hypothetical protein VX438_09065 [Planctomycetota bacterium]|nr:hypothetical protein [Planctomycetota bacterium]